MDQCERKLSVDKLFSKVLNHTKRMVGTSREQKRQSTIYVNSKTLAATVGICVRAEIDGN